MRWGQRSGIVPEVKMDGLVLASVAALALTACGTDFVSADTDGDGSSSTGDPGSTTAVDPTTTTGMTDTTAAETEGVDTSGTAGETTTGSSTGETEDTTDTDTDTGGVTCGDGVVEGDETCDDGGESETCNADCTMSSCGDGVTNATAGEACDDAGESATCNDDCTAAMCGDMVVNTTAGETCDEGGETETCDVDCTAVMCGDGVANATAGESCDDAGASATCDADCTDAECGDGVVNPAAGEACDGGPGCSDACVVTCPAFSADMFDPATTFGQGALEQTPIGIAWDGTSYWGASGESAAGVRLVQYGGDGAPVASFSPGIDFRSIFVQGDGSAQVYARAFNSSDVLAMSMPGTFAVDTTLGVADPVLATQASVVWNADAGEFVALRLGVVQRWADDGAFLGVTPLTGYGTGGGELDPPSNRRLAWGQGCYLTYADGVLSSWDPEGLRVDTATLEDMASFETEVTLSYANGMVFLGTTTDWLGFDVF